MVTIKSYTDISQSKTLSKILPLESADMCYGIYDDTNNLPWLIPYHKCIVKEFYIPCWSLAALLNILPEIQGGKPIIDLDDNYITYPHMSDLHTKSDNPVDACVDMIEKLHELNLL